MANPAKVAVDPSSVAPGVPGKRFPSSGKNGLPVCDQFFASHGANGSAAINRTPPTGIEFGQAAVALPGRAKAETHRQAETTRVDRSVSSLHKTRRPWQRESAIAAMPFPRSIGEDRRAKRRHKTPCRGQHMPSGSDAIRRAA